MAVQEGQRLEAMLEDVKILPGNWRNFSGKKTPFNDEGKRNFTILLDPKRAEEMARDGWNIKMTKEREVDEETIGGEPFIKVSVKYGTSRPPLVVMITSRGRTFLNEEQVAMLDWAEIKSADVMLDGKAWAVNGKPVMSAYLKAIYATIEEDYLSLKYGDLPLAGGQSKDDKPGPEDADDSMDTPEWARD